MNTEQIVAQFMSQGYMPTQQISPNNQRMVAQVTPNQQLPAPVQQRVLLIQQPVSQIQQPANPVNRPATSPNSQIEVKMNRLDYTTNGQTYYKDEPGINPTITIKNIPQEWFDYDTTILRISLGLKEDSSKPGGFVTAIKPLKLYENVDRRYNRQKQMHLTEFSSFIEVRRKKSEDDTYEIKLCKAMDLSRKYQGGDSELPEFGILIYNVKTGETAMSEKFVVMSKRQPNKINRDGTASSTRTGQIRMKRSEQIKSLVASNTQIVSQYKSQQSTIEKLNHQNKAMITLLKQLNKMARLGHRLNNSPNNGVLECFRICLQGVENMHWMKEQQTNTISPLNKRTAETSINIEEHSKKRRL